MDKDLKNILQKVFNLYRKYGIKSVTMDDVARELCMSKKTLYQYVEDKKDLVSKIADLKLEFSREHTEMMENANYNSVEELLYLYQFLNKMLKEHNPSMMYDLRKYYPDVYERMNLARRKLIYEGMMHNLKKGQKEGFFRKDFNCEIIANLHVFRIENIVDTDLFDKRDFESADLFKEILTYHLRGIATDKGIKYFEKRIKEIKPE